MRTVSSFIDSAGRWFLESGIQEPNGGVARYYRRDTGKNHPVSTEITGYAASTLVWFHSLTGEPKYLEAAIRAGRFLTRSAWDPVLATLPFELGADGSAQAYFFDCGIVARGLLALWRATGDSEFLETARACGDAMARDFAAGAEFHPIVSLPAKQPAPRDARWSRNPGCYQLKSALAWLELAEAAGDPDYRSHYETVLDYSLRTHRGFPSVEPERERVMDRLHAYCYFLEGLLPHADRPDCSRVFAEAMHRVARCLREIAPVFQRSDVYAQLLRLRLFADSMGIAPLDAAAAEQEAEKIREFHLEDADPRARGGFCFGRKASGLMPHVNPVCTSFCAQALEMWSRRGECRPSRLELI